MCQCWTVGTLIYRSPHITNKSAGRGDETTATVRLQVQTARPTGDPRPTMQYPGLTLRNDPHDLTDSRFVEHGDVHRHTGTRLGVTRRTVGALRAAERGRARGTDWCQM